MFRMYRIIGADGKEYGPVTAEQLRAWIAEGRANADTRVAKEGFDDWKRLGSLPEFAYLLVTRAPIVAMTGVPMRRTHSLAVASLVMGILSMLACLCCYGLPFNLLGVVFALMAQAEIRRQPDLYEGKGIATTGLVLSVVSILFALLILMLGLSTGWWHNGKPPTYRL